VHPVIRYQFGYQPQKSTETVLHFVNTYTEEAMENIVLGAFLDIERAFDTTSHITM
jgi:hypothetical protein